MLLATSKLGIKNYYYYEIKKSTPYGTFDRWFSILFWTRYIYTKFKST
jgi:hypothetical protein